MLVYGLYGFVVAFYMKTIATDGNDADNILVFSLFVLMCDYNKTSRDLS